MRPNSPIQGTAADGFKAALTRLWETRARVPSAVGVLAVHDEVVIEVDADEAERARDWLIEGLTHGMRSILHTVPVVEATIAADWSGTPIDGAVRRTHARERDHGVDAARSSDARGTTMNEQRHLRAELAIMEVVVTDERSDVLTVEEIDGVIVALLEGQGAAGATDEQMEDAVMWARKARIGGYLLDLVLDDKLVMRLEDGGGYRFVARGVTSGAIGTLDSDNESGT